MNKRLLFSLVLIALAGPLALAKPAIDVDFAIKPGHEYLDAFDEAQLAAIRAKVGTQAAALLEAEFPLYEFVTGGTAPNRLMIGMQDDPAAAAVEPAVVLMLSMNGRRSALKLTFREDVDRHEPPVSVDAFVLEILRVIERGLEARSNDFVTTLLSSISVAEEFLLQPQDLAFVLPFTAEEYNIGDESRFLVKTTKADASQLPRDFNVKAIGPAPPSVPEPFAQRLRVSAENETAEKLQRLRSEALQPQAVMLIFYERVARITAPSPSTFSTGGGSR